MGILNFLRRKHRPKQDGKLVAGVEGGTVTPKVSNVIIKPPQRKLFNRLKIINNKLNELKKQENKEVEIEKWSANLDKTKALLWIYYDKQYEED